MWRKGRRKGEIGTDDGMVKVGSLSRAGSRGGMLKAASETQSCGPNTITHRSWKHGVWKGQFLQHSENRPVCAEDNFNCSRASAMKSILSLYTIDLDRNECRRPDMATRVTSRCSARRPSDVPPKRRRLFAKSL